jgi:hypothetical protein
VFRRIRSVLFVLAMRTALQMPEGATKRCYGRLLCTVLPVPPVPPELAEAEEVQFCSYCWAWFDADRSANPCKQVA